MPLQIRRGTDAERLLMAQPLAQGELLYTTDTKRIFVGDNVTLGGIAVTGYTNEDAIDAVGAALVAGTHSGITFTYGSVQDTANRIDATVTISSLSQNLSLNGFNITGTGNINIDGRITGDFEGSLFADDSTLLVDSVSGRIVGPVFSNVTGNVTGDLTGNVTGNLTGNVTGNLTGNVTGNVTGDITGSIFADDSSLLVDSIDKRFYGVIDTGDTVLDSDSLTCSSFFNFGTENDPISFNMNLSTNFRINQVLGVGAGYFTSVLNRGTLGSPTAVQPNDELGGILINGYTSSSTTGVAGLIGVVVDPTAVISGGSFIKSQIIISAATDTTQNDSDALVLDSAGVVSSNAFCPTKYLKLPVYADDTARSTAIPTPETGMVVFMTSGTVPTVTNKPVIYNGSAWEAF